MLGALYKLEESKPATFRSEYKNGSIAHQFSRMIYTIIDKSLRHHRKDLHHEVTLLGGLEPIVVHTQVIVDACFKYVGDIPNFTFCIRVILTRALHPLEVIKDV